MKIIFILAFLAFRFSCSFGQDYREVIEELDKTLDNKATYIEQKETSIQQKKDALHILEVSNDLRGQILVSLELVYEYQSFVYDSAQYYVNKAKRASWKQPFLNKNCPILD